MSVGLIWLVAVGLPLAIVIPVAIRNVHRAPRLPPDQGEKAVIQHGITVTPEEAAALARYIAAHGIPYNEDDGLIQAIQNRLAATLSKEEKEK